MLTKDFFKRHKLDSDSLKAWFADPKNRLKKEETLNRVSARLRDGIARGLRSSTTFWAIDKAFDVSFSQTTATLVRSLMSMRPDDDRVLNAVKEWQLEADASLWCDACDDQGNVIRVNGKPKKILNVMAFAQIFVPVVKAYETIRLAKIFADRDLTPMFKYEPARFTELNRLRCEILTDRVQMMAAQMGYRSTLRQSIHQTLMYGICIQFPKESWWTRKQGDGTQKVLQREGVRYHTPHPTRMYFDQSHGPSTMNSDTGCRFAGHWEIVPYGEIRQNPDYWNKEQVGYGSQNWLGDHQTYFTQIYPCTMSYPVGTSGKGVADNDRDAKSEFYATADDDKAVFRSVHYELITPKDAGFSDYDEPVWFRFLMANEATPLFIEPMPACPLIYYGYDADENRARNASLALEALPFQDEISNILTHLLIGVRQNLDQVTFYDKGQIEKSDIEALKATGHKRLGQRVWLGFSAKENRFSDSKPGEAFHNVGFEKVNTVELINAIKTVLDILERVLVMSSQEVAQAATHEQTAKETQLIAATTSVRVNHTGGFIDDAIYAWKNQLYQYLMAFGSDDVYAQVPSDTTITKEKLTKLGFSFDDEDQGHDEKDDRIKRPIKGKKANLLMLEGFSSTRDSANRINTDALGSQMVEMFKVIGSSPDIVAGVGVKQLVALINQILVTLGLPRDYRLKLDGTEKPAEAAQAITALAQQVAERIKSSEENTVKLIQQSIAQAMQPVAVKLQETEQQTAQALAALGGAVQQAGQKADAAGQAAVAANQTAQAAASVATATAQRVGELEGVHVVAPSTPAVNAATTITQGA